MEDGHAEVSWVPTPDMANPVGNVHGGVVATIVDEVTGMAVISMLEAGSAPTGSLQVDYLHAIPIGPTYKVVGEVVRLGRAVAVADARISDADGKVLTLEVLIKPELRANSAKELPADYPPFEFGLLSEDGDDYIVTTGAFAGQRGFLSRDESGALVGCDLAGRMFTRVPAA